MKKLKLLSILLTISLLTSCVTIVNPDIGAETPFSSSADSEKEASSELASESASAAEPPSTDPTIPDYIASPPDASENGIYYVYSFDDLISLAASDELPSEAYKPIICIGDIFEIEYCVTLSVTADIVYLPTESLSGACLTFRSYKQTDICIWCASTLPFATGILSIDAPNAALTIYHNSPPELSEIELYSNVASYNGVPVSGSFGGDRALLPESAELLRDDNNAGEPLEISVYGNLLILGIPLIVNTSELYDATVSFKASDGSTIISNGVDLTRSATITFTDSDGHARTYMIVSERLSYDIPLVEINIDDGGEISSKTEYVHGIMTIDGIPYHLKIRGRGNSSWSTFPKKSYRLKLDKGAKLFGLAKNRDWVLTCNYTDKTLIRNCVAHEMAKSLSGLDFTSSHILINLYINGEYRGVYTFSDKIEDGNGRLDIGGTTDPETGELDVGFLLEIGWDFDGENVYGRDYFDTKTVFRIYVKEPDIEYANCPEFLYVLYYTLNMEKAIMEDGAWEAYIDVDSWIDWLIINELTFNTESSFYRSCYLWRESGGKVHLGPVWDFDMAFGNHYGDIKDYDGWCTTEATYQFVLENWMSYLMKSKRFTDLLVKRWNEVKDDLLAVGLNAVQRYSTLLDGSEEQNFRRWDIMSEYIGMASVDPYVYNTYEKQVEYLKSFIEARWEYIDKRLNSSEYS